MKVSQRTAKFLFPPTIAFVMSGAMSFALTVINQGLTGNFVPLWLTSFGISFVVGLPISAFAVPRIQSFYDGITERPPALASEDLNTAPPAQLKQPDNTIA